MNFGKWIVVAFVLFTAFIATLVTVCVRQDINLVRPDYYQEELVHQRKMTLIQNARALETLPVIGVTENVLTVSFPDFDKVDKGEIQLLRPSDEKLDRKFSLRAGERIQQFALDAWSKGLYRASIQWTMGGKEFYYERIIVL
ncbi:MAG: FixH family protein [Cyclobacteriaceae bacterium]